jgi:superfamily II helicase
MPKSVLWLPTCPSCRRAKALTHKIVEHARARLVCARCAEEAKKRGVKVERI